MENIEKILIEYVCPSLELIEEILELETINNENKEA